MMTHYVPAAFRVDDPDSLHQLIHDYPFGCWITLAGGELVANHLPWYLEVDRGPQGTLLGHVARANPIWQAMQSDSESLVVFQGPSAYVSPNWYPSKAEHGRVVPTWNYAVVHAYGRPAIVHDESRVRTYLERLTERHEAGLAESWQVNDAPADFLAGLLQAIVAIELPVARIIGKWKLSQNRSVEDRRGVIGGLREQSQGSGWAMAELMEGDLERRDRGGE
ncbi:MAG: FMN-binding negative transcriptional regulator [Pirellulales bacterium]